MNISSKCKRHPDKETLLSCTSCGEMICPSCLVQSFVGLRCPDCAKSTALNVPKNLLLRSILFSLITGSTVGFLYVFSHWMLNSFLFLDGILLFLGLVMIGEIVARSVSNQQSRIFKIIIFSGCLLALLIIIFFIPESLLSPYAILGTLAGVYISTRRG
jgi:hypothetical protein